MNQIPCYFCGTYADTPDTVPTSIICKVCPHQITTAYWDNELYLSTIRYLTEGKEYLARFYARPIFLKVETKFQLIYCEYQSPNVYSEIEVVNLDYIPKNLTPHNIASFTPILILFQ